MLSEIIFLEVPFAEKDQAKSQGARWNPQEKKWFIRHDQDATLFERWIPNTSTAATFIARAPVYVLRYDQLCWKCNERAPLYCLASHGFQEEDWSVDYFTRYAFLRYTPDNLHRFIKEHLPSYYPDYTQQSNAIYYVNHCHCGAKFGDFYLHNEPEGAFLPMLPQQAKSIMRYTLIEDEDIPLDADYCTSEPEFILPYSVKVTLEAIVKR